MSVRVGPHVDVKGSQSQPYRVTLLDPGRLVEVHRFPRRREAADISDPVHTGVSDAYDAE